MIRQFINNFGRVTYRVKRFSQLVKEDFKEVFFSERKEDIQEWIDKSWGIGYEVMKIMEFYDCDGNDFKHWIDGIVEKLKVSNSNKFGPISLACYVDNPKITNIENDIKKEIFNSKHGSILLDFIWKSKINTQNSKYKDLLKINNHKRIYDNKIYLNLFLNLYKILEDPSFIDQIDTNTIFKPNHIIIDLKNGRTFEILKNPKKLKELLVKFFVNIKGYEN